MSMKLMSSRRKPYPYDIIVGSEDGVGGVGVMLKPADDGVLVGVRAQPLEANPESYEYGSQSPFLERTYAFKDLVLGMGQRVQEEGAPRRYYYALNADMSINGRMMKGPKFNAQTVIQSPDVTQAITQLILAKYSGSETLFAAAGRYLYRRTGDHATTGWAQVHDFGSGNHITQMARFMDTSGLDALYICTSTSTTDPGGNARVLARLNGSGTTVAEVSSSEGPPSSGKAAYIEVVGDELWVGWGNFIAKAEHDPFERDNWAGAITIGDASSNVTWLRQNHNELFVFKTNGVYTISTEGLDQELFPGLRVSPNVENGRNAAVWLDSLWAPFRDGFYKIETDGTLKPVGTEQLLDNGSEVQGQIRSFVGHNTWFGYVVIYNHLLGHSYLLKYGSWVEDTDDGRLRDVLKQREVYHGSLKKWTSKQVRFVQIIPFSGSNDRLYACFEDGTVEWCTLPRMGPNPANDTGCQFTTDNADVYLPVHHAGFQADWKAYRGFSAFGPIMDASNHAEVYYQTDASQAVSGTYNAMKIRMADATPAKYTLSGQRVDFEEGANIYGKYIHVFVRLKNNTASETPVLEGIAIHEQVRAALIMDYTFTVKAHNNVPKQDGSVDRRRAETIRTQLRSAVSQVGTVPVIMPHHDEEEISFIDYKEVLQPFDKRWGLEWDITVRGIQYRTLTSQGASGSGSNVPYFNLGGLTYGTLENYTYGELEDLVL